MEFMNEVNTLNELRNWVRHTIDHDLAQRLATPAGRGDPGRLYEAMRYAVLGGGKRLRPLVAVGACVAAAGCRSDAVPVAAAVELLHAYTLVHDDLPAMDDDVLRRGRPTVHVEFGEAEAILVGDALLTAAFRALADLGPRAADAVRVLGDRAGVGWLIGGQAHDVAGPAPVTFAELEQLHARKTGALFAAAAELGAIAAGATEDIVTRLGQYGMAFGLAFQHADDAGDGDHREFAAVARARIVEIASEIESLLAPLGAAAAPLVELAHRLAG